MTRTIANPALPEATQLKNAQPRPVMSSARADIHRSLPGADNDGFVEHMNALSISEETTYGDVDEATRTYKGALERPVQLFMPKENGSRPESSSSGCHSGMTDSQISTNTTSSEETGSETGSFEGENGDETTEIPCDNESYQETLKAWLKSNRMHKYYEALSKFSFPELFTLDQEALAGLNFTKGAINKFLGMLNQVREDPNIFHKATVQNFAMKRQGRSNYCPFQFRRNTTFFRYSGAAQHPERRRSKTSADSGNDTQESRPASPSTSPQSCPTSSENPVSVLPQISLPSIYPYPPPTSYATTSHSIPTSTQGAPITQNIRPYLIPMLPPCPVFPVQHDPSNCNQCQNMNTNQPPMLPPLDPNYTWMVDTNTGQYIPVYMPPFLPQKEMIAQSTQQINSFFSGYPPPLLLPSQPPTSLRLPPPQPLIPNSYAAQYSHQKDLKGAQPMMQPQLFYGPPQLLPTNFVTGDVTQKRVITCFTCGNPGHKSYHCNQRNVHELSVSSITDRPTNESNHL